MGETEDAADPLLSPWRRIPQGALGAPAVADFPEPVSLRRMMGPGIVLAGLALGSGELVLWPFIVSTTGFVFFWACLLGVTSQYFLNLEIERWSLLTGESAVTGMARLGRGVAWVLLFLHVVPWLIPAWARGAAELLSWIFWPEGGGISPTWLAVGGLFACGFVLSAGKFIYDTVERVQMVLVTLITVLVVGISLVLLRPDAVAALVSGSVSIGSLPPMGDGIGPTLLLGAIAFAGAGGSLNLCQSSYVMDKGYGMGKRAGRLTSPLRGDETDTGATCWVFPLTKANLARWRVWWRRASLEHLLTFFATCVICLVVLALIAYCVFFEPDGTRAVAVEGAGHDLSFLRTEAGILRDRMGGSLSLAFLLAGVAILLTTELGVLDAASRISTDLVAAVLPRRSRTVTRSRLYFAFLWGTILLSCALLVLGTEKLGALSLFRYTAAMNGGVMFLYTGLLLYLNRCRLPREVRTSTWRAVILLVSIAFYGFFAVWAVVSVVGGG